MEIITSLANGQPLPSPRVTHLARIHVDALTGLHAFPYNDQEGTGNHVLLWTGPNDARVLDLPNAGFPVKSGVTANGKLYVVCGDTANAFGPVRVTVWDLLTGLEVPGAGVVYGENLTRNPYLVVLPGGVACVTTKHTGGSANAEIAYKPAVGAWQTRWDKLSEYSGSAASQEFAAVVSGEGELFVLIFQDGHDSGALGVYREEAGQLALRFSQPDFLYKPAADGTGHHDELAKVVGIFDPYTHKVLMSYARRGYLPMCGQLGANLNLTHFPSTPARQLFKDIYDSPIERVSPVPVFAEANSITILPYAFKGDCTREVLFRRVNRQDKSVVTQRALPLSDFRFIAWGGKRILYRTAPGMPFQIEQISENDTAPIIELPVVTINDTSVAEDGGAAQLTVSLSKASAQQVQVTYATSDGTATSVADYAPASPGTVIFQPGETSKVISIGVIGDTVHEPDKYFFVNLTNAVNATLGRASGIVTILNDDAVPLISINDVSVFESASAVLEVRLSAAITSAVTVDFRTADGSASAQLDYTAQTGTLTFAPGEVVKLVTIPLLQEPFYEADESFSVLLSNPTNAGLGVKTEGVVTILNDDPAPSPDPELPKLTLSIATNKTSYRKREFIDLVVRTQSNARVVGALNTPGGQVVGIDRFADVNGFYITRLQVKPSWGRGIAKFSLAAKKAGSQDSAVQTHIVTFV